MEQKEWETTFQVSIPDILEPERFTLGRKKFLDRLWREIEPIRKELGYPADAPDMDKLIWRIDNKDRVKRRMTEISTQRFGSLYLLRVSPVVRDDNAWIPTLQGKKGRTLSGQLYRGRKGYQMQRD